MSGGWLARIKSQLCYELAFAFKGSDPFLVKILADKGMIKVESDEYDARVKYVVPTALALKYYETLGKYLVKSQAT
jgi:hypothetical protein